ncbi:MAG: hypothetical protein KatS3mg077_2821 [Candidatus Binatia bacterium]|nr:MAG: hypothetical protein KatS3mg077_2821 [Candidatus Binatia bacterium]
MAVSIDVDRVGLPNGWRGWQRGCAVARDTRCTTSPMLDSTPAACAAAPSTLSGSLCGGGMADALRSTSAASSMTTRTCAPHAPAACASPVGRSRGPPHPAFGSSCVGDGDYLLVGGGSRRICLEVGAGLPASAREDVGSDLRCAGHCLVRLSPAAALSSLRHTDRWRRERSACGRVWSRAIDSAGYCRCGWPCRSGLY